MSFKSGFKIFQTPISRGKYIFILWANKGFGQGLMSEIINS